MLTDCWLFFQVQTENTLEALPERVRCSSHLWLALALCDKRTNSVSIHHSIYHINVKTFLASPINWEIYCSWSHATRCFKVKFPRIATSYADIFFCENFKNLSWSTVEQKGRKTLVSSMQPNTLKDFWNKIEQIAVISIMKTWNEKDEQGEPVP